MIKNVLILLLKWEYASCTFTHLYMSDHPSFFRLFLHNDSFFHKRFSLSYIVCWLSYQEIYEQRILSNDHCYGS